LNDTVVILLPPCPLEATVLRETDPQATIWKLLLPEEAQRLPAELQAVDAYLDDERFVAPWRVLFSARLGRPSVPIDTLLRLLYLKHRYQLGCESLCREVADSMSWRRFCRIPLDRPPPHPTTLVKLVRRAGPKVIDELNAALLAKLAAGKLLRARKLRVDTTVVERLEDWTPVLDEQELAEAKARRVTAGGTDILLYRPNRQDLRAGKPLQPSRWPAAQGAGHRRAGQVPLASEHLQLGGRLDPARPRDRAAALLPGPPPGRNHRGARPPLG
jgi:hypothetical protein